MPIVLAGDPAQARCHPAKSSAPTNGRASLSQTSGKAKIMSIKKSPMSALGHNVTIEYDLACGRFHS
jgi:hypothetical protein